MRGNKLAQKPDRTIEIGWIHEGQQVRSKTGGGTQKIPIPKDADATVIIEEAKKLFFPGGVSRRGITTEDVNFEVCDFSMRVYPPNQTVGDTYDKEKPCGNLRWYLSSSYKLKPSTESQPSIEKKPSVHAVEQSTESKLTIEKKKPSVDEQSKDDILQPSSEKSSQPESNSGSTEDCDVAPWFGAVQTKLPPESKLSCKKLKLLTDQSKHDVLKTSGKSAQPESNPGLTRLHPLVVCIQS